MNIVRTALWSRFSIWAWIIASMLVLLLFWRDFSVLHDGRIDNQTVWGRDFVNVWTGGKLLNAGGGHLLFDLPAYQQFQMSLFGPLNPHNYSYPPISYPIAQFAALFPYPVALALWTFGTGALFIHAARPWWPDRAGPAWLAVLTPAALLNIWAGHYGFLVGALFLMGWRNLDQRPVLAGLLFGLLLIKPHLAVLIPLVLVLRRDWTAIASAAATVIMLILVSGLVYGFDGWTGYALRTSAVQAGMIDAGGAFYGLMSTSFTTAALELSGHWGVAIVGQIALAGFAIMALIMAVRAGCPTPRLALLTATATFLLLPYAFAYDLTVVAIAAVSIIADPGTDKWSRRWATLALAAPTVGLAAAMLGLPVMIVPIALLFVVQVKTACGDGGFTPGARASAAEARSI